MLLEVSSVTAIRIFSPNLSTIYIHICMVDYTSWTLKNIFFNVFLCVILNSLFIYSNHCLQRYMKFAFINFVDLINDTILATEFVGAVRSKRPRTIPAAYRQTNTRKEASALYGRCRLSNTFRGRFFFGYHRGYSFLNILYEASFLSFYQGDPTPNIAESIQGYILNRLSMMIPYFAPRKYTTLVPIPNFYPYEWIRNFLIWRRNFLICFWG